MQYDDGYFELMEEESKIIKNEEGQNIVRAYKLSNGDIITCNGLLLEFENNMFYEVVQKTYLVNPIFERTGKKCSPNDLNNMFN